MAEFRSKGAFGLRAIVAAVVAVPVVGLSAWSAAPRVEKEPTKVAMPTDEVAEALAILKDLQAISAAVEQEEAKVVATAKETTNDDLLKRLGRPERKVVKTTFGSAEIDAMIAKALAESKTPPAKLTGDAEFVRRVCLDVTGQLPAPEQVLAFLRNTKPHKRADLIDYLLATPEYAQNWARYWRDVIRYRATVANPRLVNWDRLEGWLAGQFAQNTPWDEIVRQMITATGNTEENGAAVFFAAHMAQPVEVAGEVSRVFLGVQIQCAQCHDHPTDPWKREQFHEFAAFVGGVQARRAGKGGTPGFVISDRRGVPRYTMPDLKDPQKSIPVQPKFFLASSEQPLPKDLTSAQRRELLASYITGQDNPWFAKAFVNRVWYTLMGDGFYNPVDDLGPDREANNPEVIDALAQAWQEGGYDIRWLFRTILNTKTYQREFRSVNTAAGKVPFAANNASRLRADQIFDALAHAIGFSPAAGGRLLMGKGAAAKGAIAKGQRNLNPRNLFNFLFGVDPSTPNEDVLGTIPQALFLMNSPQINNAIRADAKGSILGEILATHPDNRAALEALYLRVLARRPTADEVKTCGRYLARVGDRREAFEDILWALINTTEFISRR
ncbi:MAG: DUF1549 domain-containing protein [Isosphaeraceae bacterium]|nr:DUF1549 domain-containing protein [Isosphaeraceae bacterium]